MKKSLSLKLTLCCVLLAIIAIFATASVLVAESSKSIIQHRKEKLQVQADYYAEQINAWMSTEKMLVEGAGECIEAYASLEDHDLQATVEGYYNGRSELLNFYFGRESDGSFFQGNLDASTPEGYDPRERGWYKAAVNAKGVVVTDPYWDVLTNQMCGTIAYPIYFGDKLVGCIGIDMTLQTVTDLVMEQEYEDNMYGFLIDSSDNFIAHKNEDYLPTEDSAVAVSDVTEFLQELVETPGDVVIEAFDYDGTEGYFSSSMIDSCGWKVCFMLPRNAVYSEVVSSELLAALTGLVMAVIIAVVMTVIIGRYIRPIKKMAADVAEVSKGNLSIKVEKIASQDEIGVLNNSLVDLIDELGAIIKDSHVVLAEMGNYNLIVDDMRNYSGEYNELAKSVNSVKNIMNNLIKQVQQSVSEVEIGTGQLAQAAESIANCSETQSTAIVNLQTNMLSISEGIQNNADNCARANTKINDLEKKIEISNDEMLHLYTIVEEIERMSTGIQKVVDTIDSISFQTNILALNASVEAARAGESGRGFAVVAEEVSALAHKTSEESHKTQELIDKTIKAIVEAKKHADSTVTKLREVVTDAAEITSTFNEISEDTEKQADRIKGVDSDIDSITGVVASNTATSEETAASTEELSGQARSLKQMLGKFKTM